MDWGIRDTRKQEQGRLGKENVQREQVMLFFIISGQTVTEIDVR